MPSVGIPYRLVRAITHEGYRGTKRLIRFGLRLGCATAQIQLFWLSIRLRDRPGPINSRLIVFGC